MGLFEFFTSEQTKKERTKPAPQKKEIRQTHKEEKKKGSDVKSFSPSSFDDVAEIIDYLVDGNPAIVCLTELKQSTIQRVVDLLSGAIYAIGGKISPLQENVYLLSPNA